MTAQLREAASGDWCVAWRTPRMPASAFTYYRTLREALMGYVWQTALKRRVV